MRRIIFASLFAMTLWPATAAFAQQKYVPPSGGHAPAGHYTDGHGAWVAHPGWQGDIHHFNAPYWRGGHWWHGPYVGVLGWWWIVGPDWYLYPTPTYPYPDPYTPPGLTPGYWYWCDAYQQYYPYVGACPSGWRAVPHQ
jgi:hypothetical protein